MCRANPHRGGVELLASAHWLAAVGGDGMLEIDANPNPLRSATSGPVESVVDGRTTLADGPGLGADPDLEYLKRYAIAM